MLTSYRNKSTPTVQHCLNAPARQPQGSVLQAILSKQDSTSSRKSSLSGSSQCSDLNMAPALNLQQRYSRRVDSAGSNENNNDLLADLTNGQLNGRRTNT
jgi:hypothetical protein